MKLVFLGTILNYRGVKGDFTIAGKIGSEIDNKNVKELYIGYSPTFSRKFAVEKFENFSKGYQIKLSGIDSKEQVTEYNEQGVYIDESLIIKDKSVLNLVDGDVFNVYDNSNLELIGQVLEIWEMPANDVLYVKTSKGNLPIPIIDEVITKIDNESKEIYVNMISGLWELLERNDDEK